MKAFLKTSAELGNMEGNVNNEDSATRWETANAR